MNVPVNARDGVAVSVGEGGGGDDSDSDAETLSWTTSGRVPLVLSGFEQATARKATRTIDACHIKTFAVKSRALIMGGHQAPR